VQRAAAWPMLRPALSLHRHLCCAHWSYLQPWLLELLFLVSGAYTACALSCRLLSAVLCSRSIGA
jgi:hypothetical protein